MGFPACQGGHVRSARDRRQSSGRFDTFQLQSLEASRGEAHHQSLQQDLRGMPPEGMGRAPARPLPCQGRPLMGLGAPDATSLSWWLMIGLV